MTTVDMAVTEFITRTNEQRLDVECMPTRIETIAFLLQDRPWQELTDIL